MAISGDNLLDELLKQTIDLMEKKQITPAKQPTQVVPSIKEQSSSPTQTEYQAPIKGTYYNSGDYSPNSPTDKRHMQGHKGVDLRASGGTAVYPIADGVVTGVGTDPKGGNVVFISYLNNVKTYYAHLGTVTVHKGDKVSKNDPVGTVGDSGNAQGTVPHVHLQVWQNGQLQNPGKYFPVPKYTNIHKEEKTWLSDEAKAQAKAFKMQNHLTQGTKSANQVVNDIVKMAELFLLKSNS
jgi:murein DD-endopeptidase MepM/ murein hydrolase activator NlpD